MSKGRRRPELVLAGSCAALIACGARSELWFDQGQGKGGAVTTSSGSGGSGSGDGGTDGGPPPPLCSYESAGPPVEILQFPNRSASSPSLVAITDGAEGAAQLALQVFASGGPSALHSDNEIARLRVGQAWPAGATIDLAPQAVGIESHSWAELARAPAGIARLAISWFSDPGMVGRVAFRPFELASWSPGPVVDIDLDGTVALALVAGSGVGPMGVGYEGAGYGLVWRNRDPEAEQLLRPMVAVVDVDGTVGLGPHAVAGFSPPPHRNPSALWSGETYLLATSYPTCSPSDELCVPASVVITRLRPATGDAYDDSGLELVTSMGVAETGTAPGRPALAHHLGRSWLSWAEGPPADPASPRSLRVAELTSAGELAAGPATVATDVVPLTRPTLTASDQGLSLIWTQDSGDDGPPDQPGAAELVILALSHDLAPMAPPLHIPITAAQPAYPSATTLTAPRSLVITWSGVSQNSPLDVAFLARLDCVPPAQPAPGL
jgi:hypothetical protein